MNLNEKQISEKEIERNLWYIENKPKIKKAIVFLLILISLIFYGISIFKFINIKISDSQNNYTSSNINFTEWHIKNAPQELQIIDKDIISKGNQYDLIISVLNPNERILITELSYQFIYNNGEKGPLQKTSIKPLENKKLIAYNVESNKIIRQIDIEINNIIWKRLNNNELEKISSELFSIKNKKINIDGQSQKRQWVEMEVENISPYNFANTRFYIFLYLGQKLVAVNQIEEYNFYSNEVRNLETSWFYKISPYVNMRVEYETDILDENNTFIIKK